MQQSKPAGRLNRVSNRMAIVQNPPHILLSRVLLNHIGLDPAIGSSNLVKDSHILVKNRFDIRFKKLEILRVHDRGVLDRLNQSRTILPVIQRHQSLYINIDRLRLPESTKGVLADGTVHAGLAADTGIGLGHRRCRYLHQGFGMAMSLDLCSH